MNQNRQPRPARTAKKEKNANGQGTVYWSESRKRWISQFTDVQGKRRSKVCLKKTDAQNWLEDQKRAKQFGQSTYSPYPNMTVKTFLNQWVEHQKQSIAPETYRSYKGTIDVRIVPAIGEIKANSLTAQAVEALLGKMISDGYRPIHS